MENQKVFDYAEAHKNVMTFALLTHIAEEAVKRVKTKAGFDQAKAGSVVFNTIAKLSKRKVN